MYYTNSMKVTLKNKKVAAAALEIMKGRQIGRPQVTVENLPSGFLRRYNAYKKGLLNVSELARVCDLSRTTVYKYIELLES